jgi:putative sigma-54 modulation protein
MMQVTVSGRHISVTDALKTYCQEKASKLTRFYDRIQSIDVILDGKNGVHTAEIRVHTERADPFVATVQDADIYAAVDVLLDKIERQLTRHKERVRNRKHPPGRGVQPEAVVGEEEPDDAATDDEDETGESDA